MRIFLLGAICIAIGFLALQSYRLISQYRHTQREYDEILKKTAPLAADNIALQASLKALEAGHGAERELHNAGYAAEGEKMLIIIPKTN
jgi:CHASE3 domain sensor protein